MSRASEMKSKTDHWRRAYSHQELNEKAKQIEDDMFVHVKSEIKKAFQLFTCKIQPIWNDTCVWLDIWAWECQTKPVDLASHIFKHSFCFSSKPKKA